MSMQDLIAKIAKGPRAAKDLTWDESKQAMKALIEGEATQAQAGAFLMAMRIKMESVTELASMTATVRSYVAPVPIPRELGVVDLPSYAGKQDTFHALAAAAIVAASASASFRARSIEAHQRDARRGTGRARRRLRCRQSMGVDLV